MSTSKESRPLTHQVNRLTDVGNGDDGIWHVIWSASGVTRNPIESSSRIRNTVADTISTVIIQQNCRILV
ncbi:hypothetical protein C4D60_Mb01t10770 [Musa balbisiana]|uniref:Uncharacterized protein n=1 Tax=Musa balbisiana TaxID=52838 RepID=A0A4S8JLL9_MUSBA|nr:hypothetical protein C4D60_Mb01t10770 [Musa balbisiana]